MANEQVEIGKQQTPLMYVDSLVGLGFGPFVSRIILGIQDTQVANTLNPALTLVMPTAALHLLGKEIVKALENPDHRKTLESAFAKYQEDFPPVSTGA